jgi:peroxiredoxin Q/BCP
MESSFMKTLRNSLTLLLTLSCVLITKSSLASAPVQAGDKAPLVEGKDQDGNKWKLSNDLGKDVVLLYFYPKDDTKGCTKEACSMRDRMLDFKANDVKVYGVSFDNAESHQHFIFKYSLNFPLIADTDGKIADAYHARMPGDKKMDRRVSFLIGLDGRIIHVTDSPRPEVHLQEMQAAVKNLQGKTPQ